MQIILAILTHPVSSGFMPSTKPSNLADAIRRFTADPACPSLEDAIRAILAGRADLAAAEMRRLDRLALLRERWAALRSARQGLQ